MKNENKNTYKNVLITSIIAAILITSGIGMVYADHFVAPLVIYNIDPPTIPDGLKCNCDVAFEYGGITYWGFSYVDNRVAINLVGFDSDDIIVYSEEKSGDRYIYNIEVDDIAKKVNFLGQYYDIDDTVRISIDWDELVTDNHPPIITSLVADDPDDLDDVYTIGDTITITFDSDTNEPGGTGNQQRVAVDDLFTFSESLGPGHSGQWITPDTFVITINGANNAGPPVVGVTTVTPTVNGTSILSADGTSDASSVTSPALSGDFGTAIQWIQFPLTDGIPQATDCDDIEEYGRAMLDAQGSTENTLYLCTASGWIAK